MGVTIIGFATNMFNRKARFFKDKIDAVEKTGWEVEFKIAKARQVREGVRQDRDREVEALMNLNKAVEGEKDKEAKKQLQDRAAVVTENVTRFEKQMKMIDDQINGVVGSETQEMQIGLLEQLQSYAELKLMYQDYIKNL